MSGPAGTTNHKKLLALSAEANTNRNEATGNLEVDKLRFESPRLHGSSDANSGFHDSIT